MDGFDCHPPCCQLAWSSDGTSYSGPWLHDHPGKGGKTCHYECNLGCLNVNFVEVERRCGGCTSDRGPGWCMPGAKGFSMPWTAEETAETALSALVAWRCHLAWPEATECS